VIAKCRFQCKKKSLFPCPPPFYFQVTYVYSSCSPICATQKPSLLTEMTTILQSCKVASAFVALREMHLLRLPSDYSDTLLTPAIQSRAKKLIICYTKTLWFKKMVYTVFKKPQPPSSGARQSRSSAFPPPPACRTLPSPSCISPTPLPTLPASSSLAIVAA
jgi:hypothetical protein